jgi:hypothetical protein
MDGVQLFIYILYFVPFIYFIHFKKKTNN